MDKNIQIKKKNNSTWDNLYPITKDTNVKRSDGTTVEENLNTLNKKIITDAERNKLAGIENEANKYIHPSTHSADMITETTNRKIMTDTERNKLAGIDSGANKYIHPSTHPADMITETSNKKIMTDIERNKLAGIDNGAEVNQNSISKISSNGKTLNATNKTDTVNLIVGNDIETTISGNTLTIKKKVAIDVLTINVDSINGIDDNNEKTPFKTIQAAVDYVKNYYSKLTNGCNILITPGDYKDHFLISNFGPEYGLITLASSKADLIPLKGNITDEVNSVNVVQFSVINNSTTIIFSGFTIKGSDPSIIRVDKSEDGFPYVKLAYFLNNTHIIITKSYIYGSSGNLEQWKYYYGFMPYYTKISIRDSKLGRFSPGISGVSGQSGPIKVVDNSDVVLLYVKFDNNTLYDVIGEEARIHLRKCSRIDSSPIKKSISTACMIAEGD